MSHFKTLQFFRVILPGRNKQYGEQVRINQLDSKPIPEYPSSKTAAIFPSKSSVPVRQ
jgi:hypothetical protein